VESGVFFGVEFGVIIGVKFGVIFWVDLKFNTAHIYQYKTDKKKGVMN
jgi:hypothetical protein